MGTRAKVEVFDHHVTKTYDDPVAAAVEASWYRVVPWACPRLLDHDGATLTIERCELATDLPDWKPIAELRHLLGSLHARGIHHRDLHLRNVVRQRFSGRPLLIDWETAIRWPDAPVSYDLAGPKDSGVPIPEIHARLIPAWWGSRERMSIKNQWGSSEVPTDMAGR